MMINRRFSKFVVTRFFSLMVLLVSSPAVLAHPGDAVQFSTSAGKISLADLHGKAVYLDFWASWCSPCRKSFPWMNEIHSRYADSGLVVLAVNVDAEPTSAKDFLDSMPAEFSVAYDPEGKLASAFQLKAMPSSFVIDRDGQVRYQHLGFKSKHKDQYEREIRAVLGLAK